MERRALTVIATLLVSSGALASGDDFRGLPEGEGRDLVHVVCDGCHSIKLVVQQGLSRDSWAESLDLMVEEQGMVEMDPETYAIVLEYLSQYLGPDHRPPR